MNVLKVTLGFLELALAMKFLSNADLVLGTHILERQVFIGIWIAIFFVLGLYLLGRFRLPHDSKVEKISVVRALLATSLFGLCSVFATWFVGSEPAGIGGFDPTDEQRNRGAFYWGVPWRPWRRWT